MIDDAIVVVENIVVHRDASEGRAEAVRKALAEITTPLVGSTITPVVVFLPLIAVTGVTGSFFRALAITMTVALLTSLVLALSWTPALSMLFLSSARKTVPQAHADAEATGASEAHHATGTGRFMTRVLHVHAGALKWALARPGILGAICLLLVVGTYFCYNALGSDLLPEMDEGAFILDYIMPSCSSLTETNRVLAHVERILHETPEVEITSRRTGLQLGLAAVTEANYGDFTVRLKSKRSRPIDDIMADVRDEIKKTEPELDVEFTQVLQDMIGDLSNAPEPIQIKLFSSDQSLLNQLGPKVQDAIGKIPGVVDTQNGVDNTVSGPATSFQISPVLAARFGFTPTEIAEDATSILDGLPTTRRSPHRPWPPLHDPRAAAGRKPRLGWRRSRTPSSIPAAGHTATLGSDCADHTATAAERDSPRKSSAADCSQRTP